MADTATQVLVAVYPGLDLATSEFDALAARIKAKEITAEAAILVTHDADGKVVVRQTADHLGRKGAGWGGGVGVLVGPGRTAPARGHRRRRRRRRPDGQVRQQAPGDRARGQARRAPPAGSAVVIAMYEKDQELAIGQALGGALGRSIVETDKGSSLALKDSLGEAMGKFQPDRTVLPIPDRTFGGSIGRTMDTSVADWSMIPGAKPPEGAPNVLIVLVDDAGFGGPDTFGGDIRTPEPDPRPAGGPDLQPLPRDGGLLAHARGPPDRAQPPPRGHGRHRRVPGAVPGLHRPAPAHDRAAAQDPAGERVRHRRLRQVAHDARPGHGSGGPVPVLAAGVGLRPLVGLPDRRGRPVRPGHRPGQHRHRRAGGQGREALLLPGRHHGQVGRVAPQRPGP